MIILNELDYDKYIVLCYNALLIQFFLALPFKVNKVNNIK